MKLATLLTAVVSALAARAADVTIQDVYAPPFIFPSAGVTLNTGSSYTFTWDVSNPPAEITNPEASIYLRTNGLTLLQTPLVTGIPITQGYAVVQIPQVTSGDYQAVLFGDSGDFSDTFQIVSE